MAVDKINTEVKELSEFDKKLLEEIKIEHQISSFRKDDTALINYIHEGIADIDENNGVVTDYDEDLISRRLLKLYVLFADNKQLANFKVYYSNDYAERLRFYFQKYNTNL